MRRLFLVVLSAGFLAVGCEKKADTPEQKPNPPPRVLKPGQPIQGGTAKTT